MKRKVDAASSIDLVNDRICTVPDAAKHFKLSPATAWRLILSGRVASVKINPGSRAGRRTSIEAFARYFERVPTNCTGRVDEECRAAGL